MTGLGSCDRFCPVPREGSQFDRLGRMWYILRRSPEEGAI